MKSTSLTRWRCTPTNLLLLIGLLPLSLLTVTTLFPADSADSADSADVNEVDHPQELRDFQGTIPPKTDAARKSHPFLSNVDTILAKKNGTLPTTTMELGGIAEDVQQYSILRTSLEGIWDVHERELPPGAATNVPFLNELLSAYEALNFFGLNPENTKTYRDYVDKKKVGIKAELAKQEIYDRQKKLWNEAERLFDAKEWLRAKGSLEQLDPTILTEFQDPPIVPATRIEQLKIACDYNVEITELSDDIASKKERLASLRSGEIDTILDKVQAFQTKYNKSPAETDPNQYVDLTDSRKVFELFKELLGRKLPSATADWPNYLAKLTSDIAKLGEFDSTFRRPIQDKVKDNLKKQLIMLAQADPIMEPLGLREWQCLYYIPAKRILIAKQFVIKTAGISPNPEKPPAPFFFPPAEHAIPFFIKNANINLANLVGPHLGIVKELLGDKNLPQDLPLQTFFQTHNDIMDELKDNSDDVDLWIKVNDHATKQLAFFEKYKIISGGCDQGILLKLERLGTVATDIIESRVQIENFTEP
jgi:hypothetical protein